MNIYETNGKAWNEEVLRHNYWTLMVGPEAIQNAKQGKPEIWVTPFKLVPMPWIEDLKGKDVLLACGAGGQQTPLLAAYGCHVTTLDISEGQLDQDRKALDKYSLEASLVNANILDMPFEDKSFDAVIIPQALNFIDDIEAAYRQVHRVLKDNGKLLFGIANPAIYMFDDRIQDRKLKIRYTIPFSDTTSLSQKELQKRLAKQDTVEFSHTLESIMGGLLAAGFTIDGYYSDDCGSELTDSFVHDSYMAFKARKN
ncbi:MAG: class I SAM-dependent methyltransferase [Sphaerochaetaceae bacterium]|nr:class I SAM-dependent methyltransferase [Sphaerochaetaceae bacterium]